MFTEQEIKDIYNGFEQKDMPFEEFRKQVKQKTDPNLMLQDAMQIVVGKHRIDGR